MRFFQSGLGTPTGLADIIIHSDLSGNLSPDTSLDRLDFGPACEDRPPQKEELNYTTLYKDPFNGIIRHECYRILGSSLLDLVDDAIQETRLKVLKILLDEEIEIRNPKAWLRTVSRTTSLDVLRREKKQSTRIFGLDDVHGGLIQISDLHDSCCPFVSYRSSDQSSAYDLDLFELYDLVEDTLSDDAKFKIFKLRMEGHSYKEIGDRLKCSVGKIHNDIKEIRASLMDLFFQIRGDDPSDDDGTGGGAIPAEEQASSGTGPAPQFRRKEFVLSALAQLIRSLEQTGYDYRGPFRDLSGN